MTSATLATALAITGWVGRSGHDLNLNLNLNLFGLEAGFFAVIASPNTPA